MFMKMKRISVFCGSSSGNHRGYREQARLLGRTLAQQNLELVYGGARVGLMGAVADGALQEGGRVIGVLPRFLVSKEVAHEGLSELILVDSMHERKTRMNELSDGVIALPGGFGTLEEFFEMLTWAQLGLHNKPIGILNLDGFYDELIRLVGKMVDHGFLKEEHRQMLMVDTEIDGLLRRMISYAAPAVRKWITPESV